MKKERLRTSIILLLSICLIVATMGISYVRAAEDTGSRSSQTRTASWYQSQYGTSPWGGTWMRGSFGPDYGIGEQGSVYQYTDPMTGTMISYSSMGPGMGLGGPFAGYGGMFSPTALASYGPFAYGNNPQPMPTPGYGTSGYASGSLFGPSESMYSAQPGLLWMLGGGMAGLGGFGGLGLGGLGMGYGGYGGLGYGGYGGIGYGGYGGIGYGGYGGYGGLGGIGYGGYGGYGGLGGIGYGGYGGYSGLGGIGYGGLGGIGYGGFGGGWW